MSTESSEWPVLISLHTGYYGNLLMDQYRKADDYVIPAEILAASLRRTGPFVNLSHMQLKSVLVDAVLGREVPQEYAELWQRAGLCWKDDHLEYRFERHALEQLTIDDLYQLYCETRARY